jgi:hypothetical protein
VVGAALVFASGQLLLDVRGAAGGLVHHRRMQRVGWFEEQLPVRVRMTRKQFSN